MKYAWSILPGLMLFVSLVNAQPPGPRGGERFHEIRERLETMKIYKLTEEVGLTEEQATTFFPRYREFQDEMEELNIELRRTGEDMLRATEKDGSDSEIKELLDKVLELEAQKMKKQHAFIEGLDDILSVKQRARLMVFEHRFHEKMREAIREHRGFGPPPPAPERPGAERPPRGRW